MEGKGKRGPRLAAAGDDQAPAVMPENAGSGEAPNNEIAAPAAIPPVPEPVPVQAPPPPEALGDDPLTALAQSQAALAHGLQALGSEMAGLAQSEFDNAAQAARDMLGARTLAEAIEINAGFASRGLETLVAGSARLSELGVKLTAETAQSIVAQLGKSWMKSAHPGG